MAAAWACDSGSGGVREAEGGQYHCYARSELASFLLCAFLGEPEEEEAVIAGASLRLSW
jgi:hypothetical protein